MSLWSRVQDTWSALPVDFGSLQTFVFMILLMMFTQIFPPSLVILCVHQYVSLTLTFSLCTPLFLCVYMAKKEREAIFFQKLNILYLIYIHQGHFHFKFNILVILIFSKILANLQGFGSTRHIINVQVNFIYKSELELNLGCGNFALKYRDIILKSYKKLMSA